MNNSLSGVIGAASVAQTAGDRASATVSRRGGDVHGFVQHVLRNSYLQMLEDLAFYAEKVKHYNRTKEAIRNRLTEYRKLHSALAGLSGDEALNATPSVGADGTSSSGVETPGAQTPIVTSPEQRATDYPTGYVLVSEFLGYRTGSGLTALEDLVRRNPDARAKLLQAIPYMTTDELAQVLPALGGTDMKLASDLGEYWTEIVNAMSTHQVLELGAKIEAGSNGSFLGFYPNALRDPDFYKHFEGRFKRATATAQIQFATQTTDHKELAALWRDKIREEQQAAAANEAPAEDSDSSETPSDSTDEGTFDLDPADGQIDGSMVIDQWPYVVASGEKIGTKDQLEAEIQALEEKLASVGDDAQLANVDMQNAMQKQQHLLQLMSNVSKMMHDTNMAIIRKLA